MKAVDNKIHSTVTYNNGRWEGERTNIVNEQPVTLTVNNELWLTFMCTPIDLEALAVGFLYNENIIQTKDDFANLRVCPGGNNIDVWLNNQVRKPDKWTRTSGCSGGETSTVESYFTPELTKPHNGAIFTPRLIGNLMDQLLKSQDLYKKSGGMHTSVLCDGNRIIFTVEDIGRHNTLDKLAGKLLLEQLKLSECIIVTTGRISSEMIQKAGRIGASLVISRTSPTSLSIQMAEQLGITMIGYARRERFTVYAHPERILIFSAEERISCEAE
jgi:FdhD protein